MQTPASTLVNVAEDAELRLVRIIASAAAGSDSSTSSDAAPATEKKKKKPKSLAATTAAAARATTVKASKPPIKISPTFVQDCESCIGKADASGLVRNIIRDEGAMTALFRNIDPMEECVSAFSLLAVLLARVAGGGGEDEEMKLAVELADAVEKSNSGGAGSDKDDDATLKKRIASLMALYNLRSDGGEKCRLLTRIVRLSFSSPSLLNMLGGNAVDEKQEETGAWQSLGDMMEVGAIVNTLKVWDSPVEDQRMLFRAVADGMKILIEKGSEPNSVSLKRKESIVKRQRFLLLQLETYTDASALDSEAMQAAQEAACGAIQDPVTLFTEQRSMLSLPAIAALDQNPETRNLFSLLQIFQDGKLQDFQSFLQNTPTSSTFLETYNFSLDECTRYMRLLSLCSLASDHDFLDNDGKTNNYSNENGDGCCEISYTVIATTLDIPVDQVESWVIAAVSQNLLVAKMDQLHQVVLVERSVVRKFGMDQWKVLQKRLHDWKSNIKNVLEGLKRGGVDVGGIGASLGDVAIEQQ